MRPTFPTGPARSETIDKLLIRSPLQVVWRRRNRGRLAILGYHAVSDPATFGRHLDVLVERCTPVDLEQAEAILHGRVAGPRNPVLVTFDDADPSVLHHALPAMRDRGVPGVVFAIGGLIGTDQPYWWDEVTHLVRAGGRTSVVPPGVPDAVVERLKAVPNARRLEALEELRATAARPAPRFRQLTAEELSILHRGGIAVASHTQTHPCLIRCAPEEVLQEIDRGAAAVADAVGDRLPWFAYPNGDRDAVAVAAARRAGMRVALNYDNRLGPTPAPAPLEVSRLAVESDVSPRRLEIILSGLLPSLMRGRDRVRRVMRRTG